MNPQLRDVHTRIRALGLDALAHANWHAHYMHMNNSTPELSVLQAAHAAELLIKARIAEEHPLLIFDQLPKATQSSSGLLDFDDLFSNGRTLDYAELPSRLWAATGITLPGLPRYKSFGKLRNPIQHFASPQKSIDDEVSRFIYEVIDPFIHECWGLYAIDYNEDSEPYMYLMSALVRRKVPFMMSPGAAADWDACCKHLERHEQHPSSNYLEEMGRRAREALKKPEASP